MINFLIQNRENYTIFNSFCDEFLFEGNSNEQENIFYLPKTKNNLEIIDFIKNLPSCDIICYLVNKDKNNILCSFGMRTDRIQENEKNYYWRCL